MIQVMTVSTATPSRESALRLAESATTSRLAAGGYVTGPVESFFWHEGQFGHGQEWKVSFTTTATRYPDLEAHLIAQHDWTNPEVTAVALAYASAAYTEWVERVTIQELPHST
jgi:periplasmic divalent cation tolerance protein